MLSTKYRLRLEFICKRITEQKEVKLALIGLQGAGKTTIINKLIDVNFKNETVPTVGIDTKEL